MNRKPDFQNILSVLKKEVPNRPTLFEFYLNWPLYEKLVGKKYTGNSKTDENNFIIQAFMAAGYDYATINGSDFKFEIGDKSHLSTLSMNENAVVPNREAFDVYQWPDPDAFDYSLIDKLEVPDGMKLMIPAPMGVLENAIALAGYENLCIQIYDDPQFVHDLFEKIGTSLLRYYKNCLNNKHVGILMSNDDWGFNTQTMLSVLHMREFVFPWHKKIVQLSHGAGLPVVLHSCGNLSEVMDDIIDKLGYDGKHSYEDAIFCVEDSYIKWGSRIAILGGIDLDFLITKDLDEIHARSSKMLELGKKGYALGTGNSVPEYISDEKYFAMTSAVF